jgi:DNA-binding transcriptional ArsR family regulator
LGAEIYTVLYKTMGHELSDIGHSAQNRQIQNKTKDVHLDDFVFEKDIFNNIFEKDIRRVFIYKKAEQLAKAIHLIAPAFSESVSLKNKIDTIALDVMDLAALPLGSVRTKLSRELLTLSSILSIARTNGLLSSMNADIITRETHNLLQEIADYEEPRIFLGDVPTLANIAKNAFVKEPEKNQNSSSTKRIIHNSTKSRATANDKGHIKDRREALLDILKNKQKASIKDISTLIRDVSEKTIQRELSALIDEGVVLKQGERRWSTYSVA